MKIHIDSADTKWSLQVRARDGRCRKCGRMAPWKLEAHHIMPRARSATRYDIANGLTLCFVHHVMGDDSAHRVGKQFVIDIIGLTEYKRLEKKSVQTISRAKARAEFLLTCA